MIQLRFDHPAVTVTLVFAATVAAYFSLASGLPGSFLIDDFMRITNMKIVGLSPEMLALAIKSQGTGLMLGRPVSLVSLYATKFIHGNDPAAFKYENILLHLLCGVLLFWLAYRLLLQLATRTGYLKSEHVLILSGVIAAIWILHPLHVSTVLYPVQRMTILSTLFTVCALLVYVTARQQPMATLRGILSFILLLPGFMLLALFSKEDAALIPVYVLLIEAIFFRFHTESSRDRLVHRIVVMTFIVLPLIFGFVYLVTHLDSLLHNYVMRRFTLSDRIGSEAVIMWSYVKMIVLPRLSDMSLYHDAVPVRSLLSTAAISALLAWTTVLAVLAWLHRRAPLAVFGVGLFMAAHLLESTVLPLELMFEHRNYLASFGLIIAFVDIARHAIHLANINRTATLGLAMVFLGLLTSMQTIRASVWSQRDALVLTTIKDHPESVRAASALANIHAENGRFADAQSVLDQAVERSDNYFALSIRLHQLGLVCGQSNNFPAALYDDVMDRIGHEPLIAYAMSGIDALVNLVTSNRCTALSRERLLALVGRALRNPNTRRASPFKLHSYAAQLHASSGSLEKAAKHYERALELSEPAPAPVELRAAIALTDIYIELGQFERAHANVVRSTRMMSSGGRSLIGAQHLIENQRKALEKATSG